MEGTEMTFTHQLNNQVAVFELEGSLLNETDRISLKNEFTQYLDDGIHSFLIDLSKLKHINSTGLGVFITLYTKVRGKGGELVICNPSDNIVNLLTITKLTSVFTIFNEKEEALAHLQKA